MTRINVYSKTDEYSYEPATLLGWFDYDKRQGAWSDADYNGDGSGGTGRGQEVILTSGGKWVLRNWTRWQGEEDRCEYITAGEARDWLLRNHEDEAVEQHFGAIAGDARRSAGRPEIGGAVHVRLGELVAKVDEYAGRQKISRAEAVRKLVEAGLTAA